MQIALSVVIMSSTQYMVKCVMVRLIVMLGVSLSVVTGFFSLMKNVMAISLVITLTLMLYATTSVRLLNHSVVMVSLT